LHDGTVVDWLRGAVSPHGDGVGGVGAGSGGRLAVKLTSGSTFGSISFQAYGGVVNHYAAAGTVYLEKASEADRMIAELWHWVQTTPGYKNNTTFIITTDHGRGKKAGNWTDHGMFISGSSQTWLALIGPHITPIGEIKDDEQIYQKQLTQTIAALLGQRFVSDQPIAASIPLK